MVKKRVTSATRYTQKRKNGRPKSIESQDAKRARTHTGALGFQPATKTNEVPSTEEQSELEEQTDSPVIGDAPSL